MQVNDKHITLCLACGSQAIKQYLDFGDQSPANSLLTEIKEQEQFPLKVMYCENCSHSQLSYAVDPKKLYSNYLYVSGTTQTLKYHFMDLCLDIVENKHNREGNVCDFVQRRKDILEIGCNDGTLLKIAKECCLTALGVDPAENLKDLQTSNDVDIITDFWTSETSFKVPGSYDNVIALNCLAHNADPYDFLLGIRRVFNGIGYVIIEFPYFINTVKRKDYGQIYSEHHSYFTARSFHALIERAGFVISKARSFPKIHGGTYRFYLSTQGNTCDDFKRLWREERDEGFHDLETYKQFNISVNQQISDLYDELRRLPDKVIAYGASAKASTLFGVSPGIANRIKYCVDDNPLKIGRYIPGTSIEIKSSEALLEEKDLVILLTVHNFRQEVIKRLKEKGLSGRLINYVPTISVEDF